MLRGTGVTVGVVIAGGLGAAGQLWGGLAGAAVVAVGGFVAPEVSDRLAGRRSRSTRMDKVSSEIPARAKPQAYSVSLLLLEGQQIAGQAVG